MDDSHKEKIENKCISEAAELARGDDVIYPLLPLVPSFNGCIIEIYLQ